MNALLISYHIFKLKGEEIFLAACTVFKAKLNAPKRTLEKKSCYKGWTKKKWTGFGAYNSCSWAAIVKWQSSVESSYNFH